MRRFAIALLLICCIVRTTASAQQRVYKVVSGTVHFSSNAPQELIKASSSDLTGVLDSDKRLFVFRIGSSSFMGFNNPLQREHFNENYMESHLYAESTFSGKIIEDVPLQSDGLYSVRAKGKLHIHGVEQERIIYVRLQVRGRTIEADASFKVLLTDHNIKVPRIVSEKLAREIDVKVHARLQPQR